MDEIDAANERVEYITTHAIRMALQSQSRAPSSGVCHSCAVAIEPMRLYANPFATACRDCAAEEEAERQHMRRTGGRR